MTTPVWQAVLLLPLLLLSACPMPNNKAAKEFSKDSPAYTLVEGWPALPKGLTLGNPTGIDVDSAGNLWVFHRGTRVWTQPMPEAKIAEDTISKLDGESGIILESWGSDFFIMPHGLAIDDNDDLWLTDVGLHQVFKFSSDGVLLLALGEARVSGDDSSHFKMPTDVAVASDGSFYVSDGYGNSRVMKFSADGRFLFAWGSRGNKEGEFRIPHGIALDKNDNVYVADRENNRIQKFDPEGNLLAIWQNDITDQLYSVCVDRNNDRLFAIDYEVDDAQRILGSDLFRFDLSLNLQMRVGRSGAYTGPIARYHDVAVDRKGNVYVGDILGNLIQKFRREN